jgi:hypothetical protein
VGRDQKTKRRVDQVARDATAGYMSRVTGGTLADFVDLDLTGDSRDSGYSAKSFPQGDGSLSSWGQIQLTVANGTNASTLKCTIASLWNGDVIGETNNVAKGATTGSFTLDAAGNTLRIEAAGLSGNTLMAQGGIASNASAVNLSSDISASGNDILVTFRNATSGVLQDSTVLVDTGIMVFNILYLTEI